MDATLLAELGRHRHDGEAVALHRAVAAALAHRLVDEDASGRVLQEAALAQASRLRRAPLVVHHDGDAADVAQPLLHLGQAVAPVDLHPAGPARAPSVVAGVLGAHDDLRHALGLECPGQRRDVHQPRDVLPACHGDGGVVEDLEGDVDACRDTGPDGEGPGVAEGAVAQVLEQVGLVDERRQSYPGHALGPHGGRRQALHPLMTGLEVHDPVAAHAAADQRADGDHGGTVVRAAAAERRAGAAAPPGRATASSGARGASEQPGPAPGGPGPRPRPARRARRRATPAGGRRDRACPRRVPRCAPRAGCSAAGSRRRDASPQSRRPGRPRRRSPPRSSSPAGRSSRA